jgi:hypothetical protein
LTSTVAVRVTLPPSLVEVGDAAMVVTVGVDAAQAEMRLVASSEPRPVAQS